jgi:hypothetical protein
MASHHGQEAASPHRSLNLLTQRVWVVALGRYGSPAMVNPWDAYKGDYSGGSLLRFALAMRQDWLDTDNVYLMSYAIAGLARHCKDENVQQLWRDIRGMLPADAGLMDCVG